MPDTPHLDQHTQGFTVTSTHFTGTLGELAHALRAERVTPAQIDLFKLVKAYLEHYRHLSEQSLDLATETLPMLARIVELKVRLLLPRPPKEEDEEELEEVLEAVMLLEEFEDAIAFLQRRRTERRFVMSAKAPRPSYTRRERPLKVKLEGLSDIASRFRSTSYFELTAPRLTMADAVAKLRETLGRVGHGFFRDLVAASWSRADWATQVVSFAGFLELVKEGEVQATQSEPYGPIELEEVTQVRDVA